jgi:peptidoglycan/LPS O-acetylase OafA/YrhL
MKLIDKSGNSGLVSVQGKEHIAGIDSLRAVAAIIVMIGHIQLLSPKFFTPPPYTHT